MQNIQHTKISEDKFRENNVLFMFRPYKAGAFYTLFYGVRSAVYGPEI
jgi:hypothetical protein